MTGIVMPAEDLADPNPLLSGVQEDMKISRFNDDLMESGALGQGASSIELPSARVSTYEDIYALEQARRLLDCMMAKICRERSNGEDIGVADIWAFDLWISEFKRLGGL